MPTVYFVVPCYNEEEVLPETVKRLGEKLDELIKSGLASDKSRITILFFISFIPFDYFLDMTVKKG